MPEPSINHTMGLEAAEAVSLARQRFGVTLDYSPESVQRVEEIVSTIYRNLEKRRHADQYGDPAEDYDPGEEMDNPKLALMMSAYIGEVIRRRWGGAWEVPAEGRGARLRVKDQDLNPGGLVYRKLTQGGDNLWEYFQRVAAKLDPGSSPTAPSQGS